MAVPRVNRPLRIILITFACVLAVGIAAAAVIAGVVESERSSSAGKATGQGTTSASISEVIRPTAAPRTAIPKTASPAPMPSTAPSVAVPEPTAYVPEVVQTIAAPAPAQPRVPAAKPQNTCPAGVVTAGLDSITFEWPYPTDPDAITVIGRGSLVNGTTAPVRITQRDVPNLEGLDSRGQTALIALYGDYDWAPPPGVPSGGVIVLQPGESVTYTVEDPTRASMITPVTHWYSATDVASVQMFYEGSYTLCNVRGMAEGTGKAIPNTFAPKSQ